MTPRPVLIVLAAALAVVSGCGDGTRSRPNASPPATEPAAGGWLNGASDRDWDGASTDGAASSAGDTLASRTAGDTTEKVAAGSVEAAAPTPGVPPDLSVPVDPANPIDRPGPGLQAGSVDDNARFADYVSYREEFRRLGIAVRDIDVSDRHVVTVVDRDGQPLLGAVVRAGTQEVRTYADGRALLFGPLADDGITASYGGETGRAAASDGKEHRISLPVARPEGRARLDVLFLIDTTGSMGDEIDQLKTNVDSVARQIADLDGDPDLHLGMTVYRDRGDLFVTRTFDFTSDVETFRKALAEVRADGGGDTPEDLSAAFHEALTAPSWRGDDTVKLVFLVADAPPHLDYDGPDYAADARDAARRGIKVQPIASSGLDDQGEFVFRQLAQVTMGRFTFLTYGADGASPGDSTTHHVSDYAVLALDDLVVRLVADELRAVAPGGQ